MVFPVQVPVPHPDCCLVLQREVCWQGKQQAKVAIRKAEEGGEGVKGKGALTPAPARSWGPLWSFLLCSVLAVLKSSAQFEGPCSFSLGEWGWGLS